MKYHINGRLINLELNTINYKEHSQNLEPLVAAVLKTLIENTGNVVSREKLTQQVWQGRVVNESSINRNISILRKYLGNTPTGEKCIKTVPKKGYMIPDSVCSKFDIEQCSIDNDKQTDTDDSNSTNSDDLDINVEHFPSRDLSTDNNKSLLVNRWTLVGGLGITTILSMLAVYYSQKGSKTTTESTFPTEIQVSIKPNEHNRAFCLDGQTDFIEVAKPQSLLIRDSDFSISAWIKTDSRELVTVVDQRDEEKNTSVRGFSLFLYQGRIGFQMADRDGDWHCKQNNPKSSCSNWLIDEVVADNQWHHISITVDRDNESGLSFFLDGKLVKKNNPTFRQGSLETENSLRVGSRSSSETTLFPGAIGEVKLHNYILSKEFIEFEFNSGLSRSCD